MAAANITTSRLQLVPATADDTARLHELLTTEAVRRFLMDDLIVPRDLVADRAMRSMVLFRDRGVGLWMIYRRSDMAFVGLCGFHRHDGPPTELIYALAAEYWGQGYASEAAAAAMAHAFNVMAHDEVIARCDPPNQASEHVMQRIGLRHRGMTVHEGMLLTVYGLTRQQFMEDRQRQGPEQSV